MKNRTITKLAALSAGALLMLAACSSPDQSTAQILDGTDMEGLIAAAKAEGELTAYWSSSRIELVGEAFEAKYGIKVTSMKQTDAEITERVVREVDSKNVLADVVGHDDGSRFANDLIPNGYIHNYVPPAFADQIPQEFQEPLIHLFLVTIWGYNTERYPDGCPVTNIWQLTEPQWKQNIHMLDPKLRATQIQWFAALEQHSDELAKAYQDLYGKPLEITEANAALEFVKRLAENEPILHPGDEEIAQAVGTRGQSNPPIGQYSLTKHRDNKELDHALAYCEFTPVPAFSNAIYTGIVEGAKHPNAARLFINFLMTQDAASAWTQNVGSYSVIPDLPSHPDNPYPSLEAWGDKILNLTDIKTVTERRRDLVDFWTKVNG